MAPAADPVPAIAETEATGEIKDIYEDIKAATGVDVVNLIWRRLATTPGALPFAWNAVRPVYVSGQAAAEGRAFRRRLQPPTLPLLPKAALAAAGVDSLALRSIRAILDSYDRTNAMNLIGLGALRLRIESVKPVEAAATVAGAAPASDERPLPPIPPLPSLTDLDPGLRDLVDMLNAFGEEDGRVIASMYRHLAYWPGYLALAWGLLAPLEADGRLSKALQDARELGRAHAAGLAPALADPDPDAMPSVQLEVLDVLTLFVDHPIAKMSSICRALASATPAP